MADERLQFVIEAKDQASAALKNVQQNAEKVGGGMKKLGSAFDSAAKSSKIFTGVILGIGVGLVAFGKKSVDAFMESENAVARLNAVLASTKGVAGVTGEEVQKFATQMQNLTGVSDEAVIGAQSMLLTFTNIGKNVFPDVTKAGLDMATFFNKGMAPSAEQLEGQMVMLGKAFNDPIRGSTALRKVGVSLTEAQMEQIKVLQEAGDLYGAQQVLLKELNTEYGGAAEAAGKTFAGAIAIAKQSVGDFMEIVGMGIVETIRPAVVAFNEWFASVGGVQGAIDAIQPALFWIQDNLPIIAGIIAGGMTPAIISMGAAFAKLLLPLSPFLLAGAALGFIMKELNISFKDVFDAAINLFNSFKNLFAGTGEITGAFYKAHPIISVVIIALKDFWAQMKVAWQIIKEFLLPELKKLYDNLQFLWPVIGAALVGAIKAAGIAIQAVVLLIHGFVVILNTVIDTVKSVIEWFGTAKESISGVWTSLWDGLKSTAEIAVNSIVDTINLLTGGLLSIPHINIGVTKTITEKTMKAAESSDQAKGFIKKAAGGMVPGFGYKDSVPAMLTPGELILNASQQRALASRITNNSPTINISIGNVSTAQPGDETKLIQKVQDAVMQAFKLSQKGLTA